MFPFAATDKVRSEGSFGRGLSPEFSVDIARLVIGVIDAQNKSFEFRLKPEMGLQVSGSFLEGTLLWIPSLRTSLLRILPLRLFSLIRSLITVVYIV